MLPKLMLFIIAVAFLAATVATADGLTPRPLPFKPAKAEIPPGYDHRHINVKFLDDLDIGLTPDGLPLERGGGALGSTQALEILRAIDRDGGRWLRMTGQAETKMDEMRRTAQKTMGREIADLNNYFILSVPEKVRTENWIDKLNSLSEVEIARPHPLAMNLPLPPSYEYMQGYLDPAKDGLDFDYTKGLPGGTGANTWICDFEYSWNLAHQDLPTVITIVPTTYWACDPQHPDDNNHGTAVLGEMAGAGNGWGVDGASYGSGYMVAPTFLKTVLNDSAWYLGVAMTNAMNYHIGPGDVMLIEQQMAGPNWSSSTGDTGLIPIEWYEPWYNIVVTAVGNGYHVVECAGNGYQDLDNAVYNTGHAPFLYQNRSGAIIVGAGGVPASFGGTIGDRYRMPFSNYGTRLDLQGWGEAVWTTGYGTYYNEGTADSSLYYTNSFSGTSSAAPNIASAVSVVAAIDESVNGVLSRMSLFDINYLLRLTGSQQDGDGFNPPWLMIGPRPDLKTAVRTCGLTDTLNMLGIYTDYCPEGFPDFSMKLDSAWMGFGRFTYDAPVAMANLLWWFDSRLETSPVDPRPFYPGGATPNDNYDLVQAYGTWDDHDTNNVKPLIEDLAGLMTTDDTVTMPGLYEYGTRIDEVQMCWDTWMSNTGLGSDFNQTLQSKPQFSYLADCIQNDKAVILVLGFYSTDLNQCCRMGGHYVNMVGVNDVTGRIALSDGYIDLPIGPNQLDIAAHNDASLAGYEVYSSTTLSTSPTCPMIDGYVALTDYFPEWMWMTFETLNMGISCTGVPPSCYAVLEYAFVVETTIEEFPDTCDYYKASYTDFAPSGVPDFDQKQDNWKSPLTGGQFWSWCGPVALANSVWWFDSKFEPTPIDPRPFYPPAHMPGLSDGYPLVQSYAPAGEWDDHDTNNVVPFITDLKTLCKTDMMFPGTLITDLQNGFDSLARREGLDTDYSSVLIAGPDFTTISDSVRASRDVIALLGFYEIDAPGGCIRLGGHYVTLAGVCSEATDICISDPFFDKNENEPPAGSAHGATVHNDASLVSGPHGTYHHDRYHVEPYAHSCSSPATLRVTDYPANWSHIQDFAHQNWYHPSNLHGPYSGGQIVVLVEYILVITPPDHCDCEPGNANGDGVINILDIVYLINYKYKSGPAPIPYAICSGDANGDCVVNILDIVYLINYKYKSGPAPGTCEAWLSACGPPLRK